MKKTVSLIIRKLETLTNQHCLANPKAQKALASLDGKIIKITLTDFNASFFICPNHTGIRVHLTERRAPHTHLQGSTLALFRRAFNKTTFHGLEMAGNIEVAQCFKMLLESLNVDWEEALSEIIGDVPAHYSIRFLQNTVEHLKKFKQELTQNVSEYLQEEIQATPSQNECETFKQAARIQRHDVERLEQRIQTLATWLTPIRK